MELSRFEGQAGFVLTGECPHCRGKAAFPAITQTFFENLPGPDQDNIAVAACRCIGCNNYILGILKSEYLGGGRSQWKYHCHYPLSAPNESAAEEIPDEIKSDFKEALRCRSVDAYNATVEMCRRALEASCLQQGAPDPNASLSKMIDWVHGQGKIANSLRDMAHKIKLGGNRAAHPSHRVLSEQDADAVLDFTSEYFQHIYVTPARMAKHSFDKSEKKRK
jgi:hypothetical protein